MRRQSLRRGEKMLLPCSVLLLDYYSSQVVIHHFQSADERRETRERVNRFILYTVQYYTRQWEVAKFEYFLPLFYCCKVISRSASCNERSRRNEREKRDSHSHSLVGRRYGDGRRPVITSDKLDDRMGERESETIFYYVPFIVVCYLLKWREKY